MLVHFQGLGELLSIQLNVLIQATVGTITAAIHKDHSIAVSAPGVVEPDIRELHLDISKRHLKLKLKAGVFDFDAKKAETNGGVQSAS